MNTRQSHVTEGVLLIIIWLVFLAWFIVLAWLPVETPITQSVPVVKVEVLESDSLDQLATIAESGESYGIPILKPTADKVGKSPLF